MDTKLFRSRYFWAIVVGFIFVLLIAPFGIEELFARPGGGHSFSGGGGYSGGGSGGGGDAGLIIYLIAQLPPQISIPLIIGIIVFRIIQQRRKKREGKAVTSAPTVSNRIKNNAGVQSSLENLKVRDRNFSKVVFLDFAVSLFNKYYYHFGKKDFKTVAPFFNEEENQKSRAYKQQQDIKEVVVGAANITEISKHGNYDAITVEFDANYTLVQKGKSTRYSVYERWLFYRKNGLVSAEPEKMRQLACPNCGAVSSFTDAGTCEACGTLIKAGDMQWFVSNMAVLDRKYFNTSGLAHYAQEVGTDYPTVYQGGLQNKMQQFAAQNQLDIRSWGKSFKKDVVEEYFLRIYEAWSRNRLSNVRNLLSDRVYENFSFWIEAYKREGLTNKLEKIKPGEIQIVRMDLDRLYESVTVRIYASALDYVTDRQGKVKGGSSRHPRKFSEYWTFIRRTGVNKDSYDLSLCPSCGAPADKIGQAGECEYCGNKISNGDFSWVLAVITQDEVYGA